VIDVNIGNGQTGTIEVKHGSDALNLAQAFVKKHNLGQTKLRKLAALIETRVHEFCEERGIHHQFAKSGFGLREKKLKKKGTVPKPFQLSTNQRGNAKSEMKAEKNFRTIGKLQIEIGNKHKGFIIVREGDNAEEVVDTFCKKYPSIRKEQKGALTRQIANLIDGHSPASVTSPAQTPNTSRSPQSKTKTPTTSRAKRSSPRRSPNTPELTSKQRELLRKTMQGHGVDSAASGKTGREKDRPLFNLDVDIGHGKSGRIVMYRGSDPMILASKFVTQYNLKTSHILKLKSMLEENKKRALEQR
jgi:hypothetical protein